MNHQPSAAARHELFERVQRAARVTKEFQPAYVLSLLRTDRYMRYETAGLTPAEADLHVCRRRQRQDVLADHGRRFHLVMTEGALRWHVGSPDVMIEQLQHLREVVRRPNVRLGVVPWDRPVQVFAGHAFHIYDDELVVVGTAHSVDRSVDGAVVERYQQLFATLASLAVYDDHADAALLRIVAEYGSLRKVDVGAAGGDRP